MVGEKRGSRLVLCFICCCACCCVALALASLASPHVAGCYARLARPAYLPSSCLFAALWSVSFGFLTAIESSNQSPLAEAVRFEGAPDSAGFPDESAWQTARVLCFNSDWQGKNPDDARSTEVRLLWTPENLYVKFQARYRNITIFPDSAQSGRRDQLWDRDVVEIFLQPDSSDALKYKEFEVSPNGFWIDLDISHGERKDLQSGMRRRVHLDEWNHKWTAELAIPMNSLTPHFDARAEWRVNFYRAEGPSEPRFYSAWHPTGTPKPNFHVPEAFGRLVFETERSRRP